MTSVTPTTVLVLPDNIDQHRIQPADGSERYSETGDGRDAIGRGRPHSPWHDAAVTEGSLTPPLRVLILEDSPDDTELMLIELRRAGLDFVWQRVETEADYLTHLQDSPDVILADYNTPQLGFLRALELLRERSLDIPLLVVTGSINEEVAVECLKRGAHDYLLKDRLVRLGSAVLRTLQEKQLRDEKRRVETTLRESEERFEAQLAVAQKMESIGQLAAGIAHEINTPAQYVGDNICFLQDAFCSLEKLLKSYEQLLDKNKFGTIAPALIAEIDATTAAVDLAYLMAEIPQAIQQSLQGIRRVTEIVRAMKEFSHPGTEEKVETDLNKAIETTITVARNEWKYVAEMVLNFDPALPLVRCFPGELNQVILNLVVNAAHAIADVVGNNGNGKGTITVGTRHAGNWVEIRVSDTGAGVPGAIRTKIFAPFFTTKGIGKGTGQGLAIAHSVIADKHGGTISYETEMGKGTTFLIRLPFSSSTPQTEALL